MLGHAVRCAIGADRGKWSAWFPGRATSSKGRPATWRRTHAEALRLGPVRGPGHHRGRVWRRAAAPRHRPAPSPVGARRRSPRRRSSRSRSASSPTSGSSRTSRSTSPRTRAPWPRPTQSGGTHDVIVTQAISDYAANIQTFVDAGLRRHRDGRLPASGPTPPRRPRPTRTSSSSASTRASASTRTAIRIRRSPARATPRRSCRTTRASSSPRPSPATSPASSPASLTKSGTIGAVGGTNVPAVVNYWRGYENGAKSVKPDIKVLYQETDPDPAKGFNDQSKGKTIANQFMDQGADVLFQIAGLTGQGVLEAVCAKDRRLGHRRRRRPGRQPPEPLEVHRHERREEARRHGQGRRPERRLGHVQGGHRRLQRGVGLRRPSACRTTTTTRR